jgi:hypothetical protein
MPKFLGMPPRFRKAAVYMCASKAEDEKRRPARRVRWDWRVNKIVRQSQLESEVLAGPRIPRRVRVRAREARSSWSSCGNLPALRRRQLLATDGGVDDAPATSGKRDFEMPDSTPQNPSWHCGRSMPERSRSPPQRAPAARNAFQTVSGAEKSEGLRGIDQTVSGAEKSEGLRGMAV